MSSKGSQPVCRSCGKHVKTAGINLCEACSRAQGWEAPPLAKFIDNLWDQFEFVSPESSKEYLEQVEEWCQEAASSRGLPVEPGKLYVTSVSYRMLKKHWLNLLEERGWTEDAIQFVDDLVPAKDVIKEDKK